MARQKWGLNTKVKFIGGELKVNVDGSTGPDDFKKDLNGIITRGSNMKPAMEEIGRYYLGVTRRNFKAQGRPKKWSDLQPATIADRIRRGFGAGPILQRTKRLFNSLTKKGAPGGIFKATKKTLQYGSKVRYFNTHQFGDSGRNIPRRQMIKHQKQDGSQVSRITNRYVMTGEVIRVRPR